MAHRFGLNYEAILAPTTPLTVLAGGSLTFLIPGTGTSDYQAIYQDDALSLLKTNPVILDSAGKHGDIFLLPLDYRILVKDALGAVIPGGDIDPYHAGVAMLGDVSFYDLPVYIEGKPEAGETFPIFNIVRASRLSAGLVNSRFTIQTAPAADMVFTLYRGGTSLGTITFAASGAATISFPLDADFAPGDQFIMTAPSPQDSTGAFVAMTFMFTVL